jgi:hypothetical protein
VLAVFRGYGGEYLPDGGADRGVDDDVSRCGDFGKIAGEQPRDGADFGAVADGPQTGGEGLGVALADVGFGVPIPDTSVELQPVDIPRTFPQRVGAAPPHNARPGPPVPGHWHFVIDGDSSAIA